MRIYIKPEIELEVVEAKDVITSSSLKNAFSFIVGEDSGITASETTDENGTGITISGDASWFNQ